MRSHRLLREIPSHSAASPDAPPAAIQGLADVPTLAIGEVVLEPLGLGAVLGHGPRRPDRKEVVRFQDPGIAEDGCPVHRPISAAMGRSPAHSFSTMAVYSSYRPWHDKAHGGPPPKPSIA